MFSMACGFRLTVSGMAAQGSSYLVCIPASRKEEEEEEGILFLGGHFLG